MKNKKANNLNQGVREFTEGGNLLTSHLCARWRMRSLLPLSHSSAGVAYDDVMAVYQHGHSRGQGGACPSVPMVVSSVCFGSDNNGQWLGNGYVGI